LEAIKQGDWTFEPARDETANREGTNALPGTPEKIKIMMLRVEQGKEVFNSRDRRTYDDTVND
jgi:hypothetical protein